MIYIHLIKRTTPELEKEFEEYYHNRIKLDFLSKPQITEKIASFDAYSEPVSFHIGTSTVGGRLIHTDIFFDDPSVSIENIWTSIDIMRSECAGVADVSMLGGWKVTEGILPYAINKSIGSNVAVPSWACMNPIKRYNEVSIYEFDRIYQQGAYFTKRAIPDMLDVMKLWSGGKHLDDDIVSERDLTEAMTGELTREAACEVIHKMFNIFTNMLKKYGTRP